MPARKFHDDIAAARTDAEAVEINRRLWSAHGEGRLTDADAEAISCAIDARRAALKAKAAGMSGPAPTGACKRPDTSRRHPRPSAGRCREKLFGGGRPRALDRNAKARIMHLARCLSRRTEKGRAYGQITAKALAVLEAILWTFHNAGSGLCFPSYERIAEAAGCARSTVAEAVQALETAGLLTWVNRIKRVRERCADLLGPGGWRWRVLRTSNAYEPMDPGAPVDRPASKSEKPTGTEIQDSSLFKNRRAEAAEALIQGTAIGI